MKKFLLFTFTMMLLGSVAAWGQDDANSDGYHDGDVAVVNAIITNNELAATPDDPVSWDFATWNDDTPKRITNLSINEKGLTGALDVSGLVDLAFFFCWDNQLTALDLSECTALTVLNCCDNQLTELDVSGCTALYYLDCWGNQLTELDASGCTILTSLRCYNNDLTALDVSGNTILTNLNCSVNQLTALDVSNNAALRDLSCGGNQLTALDVSNNAALLVLICVDNQLSALDVSNNTALYRLECSRNQLTTLDVSDNTALTELYCYTNQLTTLDVSNNPALTRLSCGGNQLATLDVSNNPALAELNFNGYTVSLSASPTAGGSALIGNVLDNTVYLTATPNSGYTFAGWAADNEEATFDPANGASTALQLPDEAPEPGEETITVTAEFRAVTSPAEPAEYTILAWAGDNGTITPTGAATVVEGDSAVFTFVPDEGYSVDVVTMDGEVVPKAEYTGNSYTFKYVAGYHEITVTFRAGIPTANEGVEAGLKAYARDGQLYVSGLTTGEQWSVYSVTGAIIYQGTADGSEAVIPLPARGIYLIKAGGSTVKVAAVN